MSENNKRKLIIESCPDCNEPITLTQCENCHSNNKRLRLKWTSGNKFIDNFIQDAQSRARYKREVIEWIPFGRLRNIKFLAKGGFSVVYKAIWLDGDVKFEGTRYTTYDGITLKDEDYEDAKQENIKSPLNEDEKIGKHVVLKSLNNSSNINENFLNEWKNYLKFINSSMDNKSKSIRLFGITQDPDTSDYMIVMSYMKLGNLRSNLLIKKYNIDDKYLNLFLVSKSLLALHECNLVHGDLHSGNLLLSNNVNAFISDLGLSRPVDKPIESGEVYGVLPYVAPEVLCGKSYTKAADVYSLGIVMWEMTSGTPAFNDVAHDYELVLKVCKGLRPKINEDVETTEPEYSRMVKRCWDPDPDRRPTAEELYSFFKYWCKIYTNHYHRVPIPEDEPIIRNHPLSCYTSKRIDYSARLNDALNNNNTNNE